MSTATVTPQAHNGQPNGAPPPVQGTREVHVKGVPESVWCRSRCNAAMSGLRYKDYIIRLLAESQPFPRQSGTPTAT
jgi:hypothetical protein